MENVRKLGPAGGYGSVNEFGGSFSDNFSIQTPPFHGIGPNLSLAYDSSAVLPDTSLGFSSSGPAE